MTQTPDERRERNRQRQAEERKLIRGRCSACTRMKDLRWLRDGAAYCSARCLATTEVMRRFEMNFADAYELAGKELDKHPRSLRTHRREVIDPPVWSADDALDWKLRSRKRGRSDDEYSSSDFLDGVLPADGDLPDDGCDEETENLESAFPTGDGYSVKRPEINHATGKPQWSHDYGWYTDFGAPLGRTTGKKVPHDPDTGKLTSKRDLYPYTEVMLPMFNHELHAAKALREAWQWLAENPDWRRP